MNKVVKAGLVLIPFTFAGYAVAATDGNLAMDGVSSNGTSDVSIVKQITVQITNMDDLDLGTHAQLSADAVAVDDVCVFSSNTTYSVTVSSANGAFQMIGSDPANTLNYAVRWGATPLTYNTPIAAPQNGDPNDATCGGLDNASYSVSVAQDDFNTATYDTYSDTIIVSIVSE